MSKAQKIRILVSRLLCKWLLPASFFFVFAKAEAQDPLFAMPQFSPLLVNPALAGEMGKYRANLNYRTQWKSLDAPYTTLAGSFDMHAGSGVRKEAYNASGIGAGVVFLTDQSGTDGVKVTSVNAPVSYRVKINAHSSLGGGLNVGIEQRSFDPQGGQWGSQFNGTVYDPTLPSGEDLGADHDSHIDLGGGVVYRFAKDSRKRNRKLGPEILAGLSGYHLGRVRITESQTLSDDLTPRFTAFADIQLPIGEKIAVCPAFYANAQNGTLDYLAGAHVKYLLIAGDSFIGDEAPLSLEAGVYLRSGNSFGVDGRMDWGAYAIGMSYGFDYSGLREYSSGRGGFELNLRWIGMGKK